MRKRKREMKRMEGCKKGRRGGKGDVNERMKERKVRCEKREKMNGGKERKGDRKLRRRMKSGRKRSWNGKEE